jgi:membrane fusion protein (multidrug efflux system)
MARAVDLRIAARAFFFARRETNETRWPAGAVGWLPGPIRLSSWKAVSHAEPEEPPMFVLSTAAVVGFARFGWALPGGTRRPSLHQAVLAVALLAGVGAAGRFGSDYWTVGRFQQSTDNAYIHADYTTVASRLSGHVTEVLVHDNETVEAGRVLARIDDLELKAAVDAARADVGDADAALRHLDAQVAEQLSATDQEKAGIAAGKATRDLAAADSARYDDLRKSGYGSVRRAEQATAALKERIAQLRRSRAGLTAAERKIDVLISQRARLEAQRERSLAVLRQAELNLGHASIVAPLAGTVGARSLRVGQFVQAGTPLMAIVPLQDVYVVANYKETQLARVAPGQPVDITVDSFPGVKLRGRVDSVAPASGQQFSLLPAENATGNFTRIVQRVPVRIAIDGNELAGRLRPGMSVRTTVDTRI